MTAPRLIVQVALSMGPKDTPGELDWTDLSGRVKAYSDSRGRDDVLQAFQPGTATITLDNSDRMLDPSNPDGLLFDGADPIGLPLCPVKVTILWDNVEYPKFAGFLGPEAWPGGTAPHGPAGDVTLNVVDSLGHSPQLPTDIWGMVTTPLRPDWWSRMDDFQFPVLVDGSEVPNSIGDGNGTLESSSGISYPYVRAAVPAGFGVNDPGLRLVADHQVRFPATDLMPDGDEDKFSVWLWWSDEGVGDIPAGETAQVMAMVNPATDVPRFTVYVDGDDGLAYVTTFDAAGDEVDSASISPIGFSRWDAGQPHHVVAVWDNGGAPALTVWFGGVSAELAIPGDLYESDLIIGPSTVAALFDEVATWRRALSYETELVPVFMAGGYGTMWGGDTWANRLGHWVEVTGRDVGFDDTSEWHLPDDETPGLWGLLHPERPTYEDGGGPNYSVTLPPTLAEAFQVTVANGGGARWATKAGWLRARTIHALTDPTYAEHYADPVTFTDADGTLGADEYRHAGVDVTGLRIDRVINESTVTFLYNPDGPPDITTASQSINRKTDQASKDRYGRQLSERTSEWCDWVLNQSLIEIEVERFAQPHQEIENIHLDPLNDDDLAAWLITECELEKACDVVYTPSGADPVTLTDLNIQHIVFTWNPERWSVDLKAAKS